MNGETWRKRKEERERKSPKVGGLKVGSLWTDKAGNVYLVKFDLGIWLEHFEPLNISEIID